MPESKPREAAADALHLMFLRICFWVCMARTRAIRETIRKTTTRTARANRKSSRPSCSPLSAAPPGLNWGQFFIFVYGPSTRGRICGLHRLNVDTERVADVLGQWQRRTPP